MKKDITLYYNAVCKEHSYDNGFCTKCGGYQPADYNESTGSCLTHNTHSDCVLNYEIMNNNDESIQNGTWYANGFLFNLFTGAGQEATDKLRLNRNQLYNKDLSVWGGQYTGTLNFYTKIVDVHAN